MFEQSLYEVNEPAPPQQEGDFLHGYEVRTWDWSPRFLKLAGAVAVVNILLLVGVAQTSLLTTKGCDSPLVGRVCQVIDTVYVGSILLAGSERDYVDAAYERTELDDADITFVNVGGDNAPLYYPADYMKYSDPERYAAEQAALLNPADPALGMIAPGIPPSTGLGRPSTGFDITSTRPSYPKPNKNVVDESKLPTIDGDSSADVDDKEPVKPADRKRNGGKPPLNGGEGTTASTTPCNEKGEIPGIPGSKCTPAATPDPEQVAKPGDINKRPFKDLAKLVLELGDKVDLRNSQFIVEASGKLNKDGRLEKKSFRWGRAQSNDPEMVTVVKRSIEAFSESGLLNYVKDLTGKTLNLSIQRDTTTLNARVVSEVESEQTAASLASGFRTIIDFAKGQKRERIAALQAENDPAKAEAIQNEIDDLALLDKTVIGNQGKNLVIVFSAENGVVQTMVDRKLASEKASPTPPPARPSSTNQTGKSANTGGTK